MRLIDADKLKREDLCDICLSADCGDCFSDKNFEDWIASQPTAYDPDKIVEQLEENWQIVRGNYAVERSRYFEGKMDAYDRAIEIVKSGGKV